MASYRLALVFLVLGGLSLAYGYSLTDKPLMNAFGSESYASLNYAEVIEIEPTLRGTNLASFIEEPYSEALQIRTKIRVFSGIGVFALFLALIAAVRARLAR